MQVVTKALGKISQSAMPLNLPTEVEDGIRVAVCAGLFVGLGLGLYHPLTGDPYFSDIQEFCSLCVVESQSRCVTA